MPVVVIAAQSAGTGAVIGAAVLILVSIGLVAMVAPLQRRRFRSGRSARFRPADGVVREGTIVGSGKGRRIRVRDSDGTEYEVRPTRIYLM